MGKFRLPQLGIIGLPLTVSPTFFMATGFCGSKDLVVLGLSLANWSFLILAGFLCASAWLLFGGRSQYASAQKDFEQENSQRRN